MTPTQFKAGYTTTEELQFVMHALSVLEKLPLEQETHADTLRKSVRPKENIEHKKNNEGRSAFPYFVDGPRQLYQDNTTLTVEMCVTHVERFDRILRRGYIRRVLQRYYEGPNPHYSGPAPNRAEPALKRALFGTGDYTRSIAGTRATNSAYGGTST